MLARSGAVAGLCPTTEANLGDGLFDLGGFLVAGGAFGIGSDSHVSISPIEELRWLEYAQRLSSLRRVIAASQYAVAGSKSVESGCPDEVKHFAETMLAEVRWRPDPIFMLDVCESEGRLRLVEISGFSCSWLYGCDLEAVVAVAGELAEKGGVRREDGGE